MRLRIGAQLAGTFAVLDFFAVYQLIQSSATLFSKLTQGGLAIPRVLKHQEHGCFIHRHSSPVVTVTHQREVRLDASFRFKRAAQRQHQVLLCLGRHALQVLNLLVKNVRVQLDQVAVVVTHHLVKLLTLGAKLSVHSVEPLRLLFAVRIGRVIPSDGGLVDQVLKIGAQSGFTPRKQERIERLLNRADNLLCSDQQLIGHAVHELHVLSRVVQRRDARPVSKERERRRSHKRLLRTLRHVQPVALYQVAQDGEHLFGLAQVPQLGSCSKFFKRP